MEITGSLNTDFSEQEFVVQINLNGFWEEFFVCAESREEALKDEEVADRLKDSDYAPLVRPAIYKEWDNEKSFYLNGGEFACKCEAHQPEEEESDYGYFEEIFTTTLGSLKNAQNEAFQEGIKYAQAMLRKEEQPECADILKNYQNETLYIVPPRKDSK